LAVFDVAAAKNREGIVASVLEERTDSDIWQKRRPSV